MIGVVKPAHEGRDGLERFDGAQDHDVKAEIAPARLEAGKRVKAWLPMTEAEAKAAQAAAAEAAGLPLRRELDLGKGVKLKMVLIPPGEFMMGSPDNEEGRGDEEGPQHRVRISKGFYLGVYEVTQEQYQAVMGTNPSYFKGAKNPVECVLWDECQEFCKKLSARAGVAARLPTEAEWEYACRAGTTTPFHFGETISTDLANYDGDYTYGKGRKGEYRGKTMPVGSFPPNAWGLHDMHGNVWEWCKDTWHSGYKGAPSDGSAWAGGEAARVVRGGCWYSYPQFCRSSYRLWFHPGIRDSSLGFRVVVDLE